MYRYYGKLETLLENDNKFVHIRQKIHKGRRAISIIPADEDTRISIISRIHEDYVEPILPREVFKEAQKVLTGIAKIDDICAKEYICKDGCVYYNRGKKQGRCSSRKLHIEDEKLQKATFVKDFKDKGGLKDIDVILLGLQQGVKDGMNPYPITEDKFRYYITMSTSKRKNETTSDSRSKACSLVSLKIYIQRNGFVSRLRR